MGICLRNIKYTVFISEKHKQKNKDFVPDITKVLTKNLAVVLCKFMMTEKRIETIKEKL